MLPKIPSKGSLKGVVLACSNDGGRKQLLAKTLPDLPGLRQPK